MRLLYVFSILLLLCQESLAQITYASTLKSEILQMRQFDSGDLISTGNLEHDALIFNDENEAAGITYLRTLLNKDGLAFINGGSWLSAQLYNSIGASGALDLHAGGGTGLIFSVGPDGADATQGELYLYDQGLTKVNMRIISEAGVARTYGQNGFENASLTWPTGRPNAGYVIAQDPAGQIQAGLIVNADGSGSVFADTKNFRMAHPEQPGKEIWYASLEGPEAAAYERGTAQLQYGQTFIPFSDHFRLVVNPETMTVILTPHSADTYGLAVVEKTAEGFRVQEFKGGKGNFSFDWEVKGVRKGHENYRVIREASEVAAGHMETPRTLQEEATSPQENMVPKADGTEEETANTTEIRLQQNRPNPAGGQTVIGYSIPATSRSAELQIFDVTGKLVRQFRLDPAPDGKVEIPGNSLVPGTYSYSLIVDGVLKASRQMVITR
ncbi:T9SS type A sorting domain-containing protein [Flavilitoribacter nigricans]|uniref:T9SS type A sorting domain-containing protein n=1 Tax=Flavilitoribacter nigricans (strain ATCC 23147 / DSM 23189 / NBRC 102662 / NCIMB 1420 / SS-2) TaxID=1122177 RepID=A0A2D0MZA8_FLAN2|nr:T9SS type A sorting domain-containing protein [Flavilitoribacter nigricans]PHN01557.1 hypothetical protein CRP01_36260 [Flavilitoribacter nigricans DSM 23189 = NBRC 102662]